MRSPVCLADFEARAREILPEAAAAYLFGGSADEITLRANRDAFDRVGLMPRVLRDIAGGHSSIELFGGSYAAPVLVAPVASQKLFHAGGEIATAQAAAAMQAGYVLSAQASTPLEAVRQAGEGAPQWFQLYWQPRFEDTLTLLRRAEAAGYSALVFTVDSPVNGIRNREMRAGFALPAGMGPVNLAGFHAAAMPQGDPVFDGLMAVAPRWDDIRRLRDATRLPILLKGILHPEDAEQAIGAGCDGIIVSNHGGRALDTVPASLSALPAIARRVEGRVPVLLDGGIRRGTDIVKAMASGARAVLVGRPVVAALAVDGAHGAARALRILMDEFAVAMALCGFRAPEAINADCLVHPLR